MNKVFGILLIGLTAVVFNGHSIAFVPVEEATQKRVEMFKTSKSNIKKLRQLIRFGDVSKAVPPVDFHIKWSKEMPSLKTMERYCFGISLGNNPWPMNGDV